MSLLNLFAHTYFNNETYSGLILRPMIDLIERNRRTSGIKEFVESQVNKACILIINLKQEEKPLPSDRRPADKKSKKPTMKQKLEGLDRKMKRYYAIILLEEFYELPKL